MTKVQPLIRAAITIVLFGYATVVVAQESYFRLHSSKIVCIKDNVDRYLASPDDPIFIAVSSCPDIPENPLFDTLVNQEPDIDPLPDTELDPLIFVTHEELACLAGKPVDTSQAIYRYYPNSCRLEWEGE